MCVIERKRDTYTQRLLFIFKWNKVHASEKLSMFLAFLFIEHAQCCRIFKSDGIYFPELSLN